MDFKIDDVVVPISPTDAFGNVLYHEPHRVQWIDDDGLFWLDPLRNIMIGHGNIKVKPEHIELANGEFDIELREILRYGIYPDINGIIPFLKRYFGEK